MAMEVPKTDIMEGCVTAGLLIPQMPSFGRCRGIFAVQSIKRPCLDHVLAGCTVVVVVGRTVVVDVIGIVVGTVIGCIVVGPPFRL